MTSEMREATLRRLVLVLVRGFAASTTAKARSIGEPYSDARFAAPRARGAKVVIETYTNGVMRR